MPATPPARYSVGGHKTDQQKGPDDGAFTRDFEGRQGAQRRGFGEKAGFSRSSASSDNSSTNGLSTLASWIIQRLPENESMPEKRPRRRGLSLEIERSETYTSGSLQPLQKESRLLQQMLGFSRSSASSDNSSTNSTSALSNTDSLTRFTPQAGRNLPAGGNMPATAGTRYSAACLSGSGLRHCASRSACLVRAFSRCASFTWP